MQTDNLVGQKFGQYELRALLGTGGMASVYRGYQVTLRREVAVKVLPTGLTRQSEYEARFTLEAQTAAGLEHPHIVPIHDYGTERGLSYVVMRLLMGGSLADYLEHNGPLPLPEVLQIMDDLSSALDYAHSQGVIHRDIKTSNIMFDQQGAVFLVDFGIAKLIEADTSLTNTGALLGTPAYMAPEQWRGEAITPAVDQYALAVTIYTALTGNMPFDARTRDQLMFQHINEAPIPLERWRSDLPKGIGPVILRALHKRPAGRFPTVRAFVDALNAVAEKGSLANAQVAWPLLMKGPSDQDKTRILQPVQKYWRYVVMLVLIVTLAGALLTGIIGPTIVTPVTATLSPAALSINLSETSASERSTVDDANTQIVGLTAAAALWTDTPPPSSTPTLTPTTEPTHTPMPTLTPTLSATPKPANTPTIDIALAVATLDAQNTAEAITTVAGLTATAAQWTPTPDVTASIEVYLTQRAAETVAAIVQELTAMASLATVTPIPSDTPTIAVTLAPTAAGYAEERIAFVSKRDGNDEIYGMNVDGSQLTRLTSNQSADFYLDWSEANSRIAFVSNRDGNNEIYSMNADGSDQKRLTDHAAHDYAPAWSPDGSQIAFTTGRTGSWEIYIMSSNGANLTRLTENNVEDWNPAFSPDGTRIAFTTNRDGNWEIYTMNTDGSDLRRLTNHSSEDNAPVWSPDGSRLAFYSERDGNFEIYVMNADGSNPTRLTHNSTDDLGPAWSTDGSRIAFYSDRDGDDEIYIMNVDGSDVTQVTNNSFDDRSPVWLGPSR